MFQFTHHIENPSILEPSAGNGDLAKHIIKHFNIEPSQLDCVELNKDRRDNLYQQGYNIVGKDFLLFQPDKEYDFIFASPPFKNNGELEHLMKMYNHLKIGGKVISLTKPTWTCNNQDLQIQFRQFLEDKEWVMTQLPDDTFMEKGKSVPTAIISITKK